MSLVSRCQSLPREKGFGEISIPNPFRWNADMSLPAQKLRSSIDRSMGQVEAIVMMCGQYTALTIVRNCSAVFIFLWLQFCALLLGLILAQNPKLILVLVQKEH